MVNNYSKINPFGGLVLSRFRRQEPKIYHLGGTIAGSMDRNNEHKPIYAKRYFYEQVPVRTEQGELFFYGNTLKPFVKKWQKRVIAKGEDISFNQFMVRELEDSKIKKMLMKQLVRYLSVEEQERAVVTFENGQPRQIGLESNKTVANAMSPGMYAFVIAMTPDNKNGFSEKLYAIPKKDTEQGKLQHSSLVRGGKVIASGAFEVDSNGAIISVRNFSGHYRPTGADITCLMKYLKAHEVETEKIQIVHFRNKYSMGFSHIAASKNLDKSTQAPLQGTCRGIDTPTEQFC